MVDFTDAYSLLIDGRAVTTAATLDVINPATGVAFATCPAAGQIELDEAVCAARKAFTSWRSLSYAQRADCIRQCAEALLANQQPLAQLLTREQGKPLAQSVDEIGRAAALANGIAQIPVQSEVIVDNAERHIELRYVPLGVAGIITPWNAPVNLAMGPLASALYTGNCAIVKPSPYTPLTTLRIGEILGTLLPPGVLSVLSGGDDLGALMTTHSGIDKIAFTGSVATGKKVMASAAGTLKRVTLELGGNDAAIVLDDVDPVAVAKKLFFAATVNSGQVCMAIKRIYAHEKIYDALCAALVDEARKTKLGDGLDPATQLGPIQNKRQYDRVCELLEDAKHSPGFVIESGTTPAGGGYFIAPTIVSNPLETSRLVVEEQFGPLIPVMKFTTVEDAIARANHTRFGLAGSVWSTDIARATAIAAQLEVGTAWVNQHRATMATVPFGGAKESGIGRTYSRLGLDAYLEPQVISVLKN
jgi:acyl-CoA reductase-like NAD-dependent aldehyde dehydrogenase